MDKDPKTLAYTGIEILYLGLTGSMIIIAGVSIVLVVARRRPTAL